MTVIAWMTGICLASWLAVAALVPSATAAAGLGMAGPLVAADATWWLISRAARRDMASVQAVLLRSFAAKMIFYAAYLVVVVRVVSVDFMPFVVSFTSYFVALHATEALLLRRPPRVRRRSPPDDPSPDESDPRVQPDPETVKKAVEAFNQ
jgi:hypothetical protein